jgi:hypothetical protein
VESLVFGASSRANIRQTKRLIDEIMPTSKPKPADVRE